MQIFRHRSLSLPSLWRMRATCASQSDSRPSLGVEFPPKDHTGAPTRNLKKFSFSQEPILRLGQLTSSVAARRRLPRFFAGREEAVVQINQIIYFIALCEERHFTRAAKRCRISQPSITNAIKALEDELGDALFTRKPKLGLTTFGLALKPHFKRVVLAFNRALVVANGHRGDRLPSQACDGQFGVEFINRQSGGLGLHPRKSMAGSSSRVTRSSRAKITPRKRRVPFRGNRTRV